VQEQAEHGRMAEWISNNFSQKLFLDNWESKGSTLSKIKELLSSPFTVAPGVMASPLKGPGNFFS